MFKTCLFCFKTINLNTVLTNSDSQMLLHCLYFLITVLLCYSSIPVWFVICTSSCREWLFTFVCHLNKVNFEWSFCASVWYMQSELRTHAECWHWWPQKKTDINHAHKKKFKQQNTQVPFFDTLLANDIQCIVSMQNLLYLAAVWLTLALWMSSFYLLHWDPESVVFGIDSLSSSQKKVRKCTCFGILSSHSLVDISADG